MSKKCPHNRRRSTCKECGGSQICEHNRRRSTCSICKPAQVFKKYIRNAKSRGYDFELTVGQFQELVIQPCYYCGEKDEPLGIDRWDNTIGYTFKNSLPCCEICNKAKRDLSAPEFIQHFRRMIAHLDKKLLTKS
jgi:hypothetical protein